MNRIDECLWRAQLNRDRAALSASQEQRERHLDQAALWERLAELLREEADMAPWIGHVCDPARLPADPEDLELLLRTSEPEGSA